MYWTKRHVLVCTASHCQSKGANDVAGRLRLEIIRRKLDAEILVNNCGTIDLCDIGPNIVVYPDNVILSGVTLKDVSRVVAYLSGGEPPEDLVLNPGTPAEARRGAFYVDAVEQEPLEPETARSLATQHELGETWIDEQLRRGFMARKPDADGVEKIFITSKARHRYASALTRDTP